MLSSSRASSSREFKVKDSEMTKDMMNMLGDSPFAAFYRDHMRGMCYFMGYFQWHH